MQFKVMHPLRGGGKALLQTWLADADIQINGTRPWDLVVHQPRFYGRVLRGGSLGVGESYMDGDWDSAQLDRLLTCALGARLDARLPTLAEHWLALRSWIINRQTVRRAFRVGEVHYDVGDDVYRAMLDPLMIYTCGYWPKATNLAAAQIAKLDLVGRKLGLQPGMRVLDIGCGWGGAAAYLSTQFGVKVVGVTVSRNQAQTARERTRGLDVEICFADYRALGGQFDRIYSLGMFEHVGPRNYASYCATVRSLLVPDGLFLLHTIGNRIPRPANDPWIEKYIFPNSYVPARSQLAAALEPCFVVEDWHSFGPDYDRTLMARLGNFDAAWPRLAPHYGERFWRMWRYWLAVSAASFRVRDLDLWQVLLSPHGVPGGVPAVR